MLIKDNSGLGASLTDPRRRRWLLLTEALKTLPLREALERARAAEAFVVTGAGEHASDTATASDDVRLGTALVHPVQNDYVH
jgi:hypothetical protein